MATQVKVKGSGGKGKFMHLEVSGGVSGQMGDGTHEFSIGVENNIVQYLTIRREGPGKIEVMAETGDILVEVENMKPKHVKKGKSFALPSKAKRAAVRERPHR